MLQMIAVDIFSSHLYFLVSHHCIRIHYSNIVMSAMRLKSPASRLFANRLSKHKGPVTRKMFPFDDGVVTVRVLGLTWLQVTIKRTGLNPVSLIALGNKSPADNKISITGWLKGNMGKVHFRKDKINPITKLPTTQHFFQRYIQMNLESKQIVLSSD